MTKFKSKSATKVLNKGCESINEKVIVKKLFVLTGLLLLFLTVTENSSGQDSSMAFSSFERNGFNLNLPESPVSRRISRHFQFSGPEPVVLADIEGPGSIRHFWITGQNISRDVILRIYFDGEEVPYVEAPLNDFFGAMHNLMTRPYPNDHTRKELPEDAYVLNTPFLTIKPKNGFTAYFTMPFARNARVEVTGSEQETGLYYIIDWHEYKGQEMEEEMRFAARWRRESPVRDYEDDFIILDADGPGQLIGIVHSIDMLQSRHEMRWSHAGADNIYIDGNSESPAYLRGIGGEDTFGTSYGGGDYLAQTSLYSDMPYYVQKDFEGNKQKLVGYRFFAKDPIYFNESIHVRFGSRAHDIAAMAYWYTAKPVRPYFEMPPLEKRLPGTELLRGEYDLPFPDTGAWWTAGPFSPGWFDYALSDKADFDHANPFQNDSWLKINSVRGFVEFNHIYRPDPSNSNSTTLEGVAIARTILDSPDNLSAKITLGYTDDLVLQINDDDPITLERHLYMQSQQIDVQLNEGSNIVTVWLNNENQQESWHRGSWNFSFHAVTDRGEVLLPQINRQ